MVHPFLQSCVRGGLATFGSTAIACGLACQVEKAAHRLLYRWAPHKYASVDHAYGLTDEQLLAVRLSSAATYDNNNHPEPTTTAATTTTTATTGQYMFGLATPLNSATFDVNSDGESLLSM